MKPNMPLIHGVTAAVIPGADQDLPIEGFEMQTMEPVEKPDSFLQLSEGRKAWLVERAIKRLEECRTDMGLVIGVNAANTNSWAWDREVAQKQYDNDFEWRKSGNAVFQKNNWTMGTPKRFVQSLAAKMCSDLFGTAPYFAAMPENNSNPELCKQAERKIQDGVRLSNLAECFSESVRIALGVGERCVKITLEKDETTFVGPARVAVDAQGQPIQTPKKQYIFENDDFMPPGEDGKARLKKEPGYFDQMTPGKDAQGQDIWQSSMQFADFPNLRQKLVHQDGIHAGGIACADFIWPIKVPHLREADILAHVYDETLESLQQKYGYTGQANGVKSAAGQPNQLAGESNAVGESVRETVNLHEVYIRCDADEDGEEEWIFMVLDVTTATCLFAEYLGNMKMKRAPFVLIRGVESVPGRAYGNGVYKMFEHKNLFIDVQLNRIALKSSKEGSVTIVHKDGFQELLDGHPMIIGGEQVYHTPPNSPYSKSNPAIYRENLNEVDEYAVALMEKMIQQGTLDFGIISAADGSASDLNASGTATGVRNIERTGNLLQRMTARMISSDIESALELAADIILENLDPEEMVYLPDEDKLATLNRDEIRALPRDIRLLLTKAKSEESLATNGQVVALIEKYYAYPKWMQKEVRPFYIEQLKVLEVQDADQRLKEPTDEEIQQESQSAAQKQEPPKASVTVKLSDLYPSERAQILQREYGITAATPEEIAALTPQQIAEPLNNGQQPAIPGIASTGIPA